MYYFSELFFFGLPTGFFGIPERQKRTDLTCLTVARGNWERTSLINDAFFGIGPWPSCAYINLITFLTWSSLGLPGESAGQLARTRLEG
jgi:hypothetical protein